MSSLTVQLNQGWSWVSLNVEASDMTVQSVLGNLILRTGDHVKSQFAFSDYYAGYGFFGQLNMMRTDEMYAVKLGTSNTLVISGVPTALPMPVTLGKGW